MSEFLNHQLEVEELRAKNKTLVLLNIILLISGTAISLLAIWLMLGVL